MDFPNNIVFDFLSRELKSKIHQKVIIRSIISFFVAKSNGFGKIKRKNAKKIFCDSANTNINDWKIAKKFVFLPRLTTFLPKKCNFMYFFAQKLSQDG